MAKTTKRIKVFLLYAEEDAALKMDLETHLSLLHQKGLIDLWDEGKIVFYKNAETHIREHLEQAELILLLISANFLAPEVYGKYEQDLKAAYARQQEGKTQIIPVILRPCVWQLDLLQNLEPLPKGGYPVRSRHWDSYDLAFQNIAMGILNLVDERKKERQPAKPPPLPFHKNTLASTSSNRDELALAFINEFLTIVHKTKPYPELSMLLPLLHHSLIKQGRLDPRY